jgi:riboflavin biosynthesis pyrimidine reductase
VRQIFPAPPDAGEIGPDDVAALALLYGYPGPRDRPWLRANMIASTDGAAALNGRSGGLSGAADRLVFSVLRSLADVIVVGAGTARAERYRPVRQAEIWPQLRTGRAPTPPLAVVSAGLDLDPGALFEPAPGAAATIVVTTRAAPAARVAALAGQAEVILAGQRTVSLSAAIAALAGRGLRRILVEGGPGLLSQIVAGGLLDELCLTYSPVLAGGPAGRILAGPAGLLARLDLAHVLEDEGYLLCRYLRRPAGS